MRTEGLGPAVRRLLIVLKCFLSELIRGELFGSAPELFPLVSPVRAFRATLKGEAPMLDVVEARARCGRCPRSNVLGLNVPLFQNAS